MTKEKYLNLISMCLNISIFVLVIIGVVFTMVDNGNGQFVFTGLGILKYFTILSNIYVGIGAIIMIPFELMIFLQKEKDIPHWSMLLKYTAVVSVMITFLVTACYLAPIEVSKGNSYFSMFEGTNLILHLLVPVLSIIVFFVCETSLALKFRYTFLGLVPVALYAVFYLVNYASKLFPSVGVDGVEYYDWYSLIGDGNPLRVILVVLIFIIFTYALSLLAWFVNKSMRHVFYGYEDDEGELLEIEEVKEEATDEVKIENSDGEIVEDIIVGKVGDGINHEPINKREIKTTDNGYDEIIETYTTNTGTIHTITKRVKKKEEPTAKTSTTTQMKTVGRTTTNIKTATRSDNKYKDGARTYHISRHFTSGKWQVKLAHGEKAIKVLDTQKEAIDYAKNLVKTQGGSIRIHSVKGKIRK